MFFFGVYPRIEAEGTGAAERSVARRGVVLDPAFSRMRFSEEKWRLKVLFTLSTGIPVKELVSRLIDLAIERRQARRALKTQL